MQDAEKSKKLTTGFEGTIELKNVDFKYDFKISSKSAVRIQ